MHNNLWTAGSKDRPPDLGPGRYSQWRRGFSTLTYDTKSNGEYLRKVQHRSSIWPTPVLIAAVLKHREHSTHSLKTKLRISVLRDKPKVPYPDKHFLRLLNHNRNNYYQAPKPQRSDAPSYCKSSSTRPMILPDNTRPKRSPNQLLPHSESVSEEEHNIKLHGQRFRGLNLKNPILPVSHLEQVDQNAAKCVDERAALANLIANLTLDMEENKTALKQLKKANASLTQELKECKTNLDESSRALGEATSSRDSSLIALQTKQTELEKYTALNDLTNKTILDSHCFVHELKKEMNDDLEYGMKRIFKKKSKKKAKDKQIQARSGKDKVKKLLKLPTDGYEMQFVVPEDLKQQILRSSMDSLNSAAGGNFMDKSPADCFKHHKEQSPKVRHSPAKPIIAKVSTSTSTSRVSPDVAELKDMVRALLLDKHISPVPAARKKPL
ncbi:hypothetical protein Tco_0190645 [Tanacetum coccineum]